ncbi:vacuolar-sorting protein BRO1-like [Triticum dicoccoides]|uniref:vacuolar-sorting protein BRO1-like n=1 Tax=Triticum dicoccoides TaxID=85692 RepID=UPI00188FB016|nr:vacuolar-sorting protein BRO1-like [Triticum dicoccoides]
MAANVMLAIHEKKATAIDLYRPLRQYIASAYSERDAATADDDLCAVRDLRATAVESPSLPDSSSLEQRRAALLAYARALALVEPRFPISPDRAHVHSLSFTWHDAFKTNKKVSLPSVHLEKAAVLFNLGAVYSQIALAADRTTDVGIRTACGAFQSAAGAFAWLRESGVAAKAVAAGATTVDVTPDCAAMLEKLMLAQAQECFFEKVIAGGKPPALCSKVARQVGVFYEEAYAALCAPPLSQHFDRTWVSHVQLKAAQFYADACYRFSLDLHQQEEIAQEIARLRIGMNALADAKKAAKGGAVPLLDSVNKLESNMKTNLERAMKENNSVYLMRVPEAGTLGALPAASLVKSTSLAEVLDASNERLFSSLVPDGSMKALSKYTEMVDDIIRTQAEKLQQSSEITRVRLKEMDLPDSILSLEGNVSIPADLKEDLEAVQISGGPAGLEAELQQLRDLNRVNQELLVQTEEMLQKEASEDAQFRTQFGSRWTRPQSSTLTKNIQDRLNLFAGNLKKAAASDALIERDVKESYPLMSILDRRPIESALPSISRPIMSLDGNEDAIVGALKQSLRQLESLGAQRAGLEDHLKEMKRKDDILPKLMAGVGAHDDLFRKEIAKYDPICAEIADNIVAQEQLLLQIQEQNAQFAAVFNLDDYKVARERCYKQIAAAVAKYQAIKKNMNDGLNFYVSLQDATGKIQQQCSDFIMTRNIQCREMIEDVQRKLAGFNLSSSSHNTNTPRSSSVPPDQHSPSPPPHAPHAQSSYGAPPGGDPRPVYSQPESRPPYSQPYPTYGAPPQQPPYGAAHPGQYQQHPQQHQPPPGHDYGQPAYPGWRGPYYNGQQPQPQQPGPYPQAPYSAPGAYPPHHQSNYYRPQ